MWNPIKIVNFVVGLYQAYRWARRLSAMLRRAMKMDDEGRTDEALDLIFDTIDAALRAGRFEDCSKFLDSNDNIDACSSDILLGLLTASSPAQSKILQWYKFLSRVRALLHKLGLDPEPLLDGFDREGLEPKAEEL